MKFESFFRSKSKEELKKQESQISDNLETDLVHDSMKSDSELLPVNELKEKYQLRYNTYLAMLRGERKSDDNIQNEAKDINKAKIYINALNNLDNYIQEQARGERKVLRGKQIHFLNEIRDALERGVTRGYIKLPTGVGKTVLFSQVLEALKLKAIIGVPTLPLVKQTSDKLETFTNRTYGVYYEKEKDLKKEITTITYASLIHAVRDGIIKPEDVPIFIADESHRSLGPETSKAMKDFELVLEFTATPGNKNLPEKICEMTLNEAIKEGLVCRTKTIHAYTDVDLSSVQIVAGDYDQKELEKKINTHGRNMAALELYKNKFSHLKGIVNCTGVNHAKDVAELFNKNGVKTIAIYGGMSPDEKNRILGYTDKNGIRHPSMIETGEVQVITNAKLLVEGFDEPSLSVALNLDPTMSMTKAEQRGGRALRLDDSNPEKWGYVVDFIDKNSKKKPILFSKILEGAVVTPEGEEFEIDDEIIDGINQPTISEIKNEEKDEVLKPENETEKNNPDEFSGIEDKEEKIVDRPKKLPKDYDPIDWSDLNIDGLRVVVDVKEIMEVTKEHDRSYETKEKWTYETLRKDVISKGITSSTQYQNNQKNKWPDFRTLTNMPEFPKNPDGTNDWDTFLGLEKFDFEKFKQVVCSKNITSYGTYVNFQKINKWWPTVRVLTNMPEFPKNPDGTNDWDTFLGTGKEYKEKKVWTYQDLREDVINNKIKSSYYYEQKRKDNDWPSNPTSMPEFPKNPDGTNDWDTFLGTGKEYKEKKVWTYQDLREDVISKNIKSSSNYKSNRKNNRWPGSDTLTNMPEFPKNPDGTKDWDTFLGTGKEYKEKKVWTYEKLRQSVLEKLIKSSGEYYDQSPKNRWPGAKGIKNIAEFPKNPDGTNDWDTFLNRNKK